MLSSERPYLNLLNEILQNGDERDDRTKVGTRSIFGARMEFDISERIPIITTKRVYTKGVIGELLWMISGSTNISDLHEMGIHFWDANSTREFLDGRGLEEYEEGELGPVYGFQWRYWGAEYPSKEDGIDQLQNVIEMIRDDPTSRRIILNAWNVGDLKKMALPPCHMMCQFYVRNGEYLDCQLYQRSGDMFLGVPFNIMSYSCLTYMIAHVTGLRPGRFIHVIGDAHIYLNHLEQVELQLSREAKEFPQLLPFEREGIEGIDDFKLSDFVIEGYSPHPLIKAPMAI